MDIIINILREIRDFFFPEFLPLWFSLLGNISYLCIILGIILICTTEEKVEHITMLRRTRRWLVRCPRKIAFYQRSGPFVRFAANSFNFFTRYKCCGAPKKTTISEVEVRSVSTTGVEFEIADRGWNPFYRAQYDVLYREKGTEDWTVMGEKDLKNVFRKEKTDRTRRMRIELKKLKAATHYEVKIITKNPKKLEVESDIKTFQQMFRPNDQWGIDDDGHSWIQTKDEITITFPVPKETRGRQVRVLTTGNHLKAVIEADAEGYPERKLLIDKMLFGGTYPETLVWEIEDEQLVITMSKIKAFGKWTSAFPGFKQVDPGLLKFFTDYDARKVVMDGPQNLPEGLKDHYGDSY